MLSDPERWILADMIMSFMNDVAGPHNSVSIFEISREIAGINFIHNFEQRVDPYGISTFHMDLSTPTWRLFGRIGSGQGVKLKVVGDPIQCDHDLMRVMYSGEAGAPNTELLKHLESTGVATIP